MFQTSLKVSVSDSKYFKMLECLCVCVCTSTKFVSIIPEYQLSKDQIESNIYKHQLQIEEISQLVLGWLIIKIQ